MSLKKTIAASRYERELSKEQLTHERLSGQTDAMVRCIQARINLLHSVPDLTGILDIGSGYQIYEPRKDTQLYRA